MTSLETEALAGDATEPATDVFPPNAVGIARAHFGLASLALLVGVVLYLGVAAKLIWPEFFGDIDFLSYGRLLPMATNILLLGWLTIALIGAAYRALPRLVGGPLRGTRLASLGLVLLFGGSVGGAVAVGLGESAGGRFLELPLWADLVYAAGLAITAIVITASARGGHHQRLGVGAWYLVAAPWWAVLAWVVGLLPGLDGVPAALQNWFSVTAFTGLWLAAVGIGVGYELVGRLVPGATFHPRLGPIGFWSLAFAWVWTAGRYLQYGPTPDWFETVPVVFSAGLVVAVATVLADFAHALRGRFASFAGSPALQLYLAGLALFALMPLHILLASMRGASTVVHLTAWETGFEILVLLGAFSFWAMAAGSDMAGVGSRPRITMAVWLGVLGTLVAVSSRWVAGLQQGYTWVGSVNSGEVANVGAGFRSSVESLEAYHWMLFVGVAMFLLAVLPFIASMLRAGLRRHTVEAPMTAQVVDHPTAPLLVVLRGAALLFGAAVVAVFLIPVVEVDSEPSLLSAGRDLSGEAGVGAELYVSEGCWYCHTQQVRAIVTDVGLGPVSVLGDYARDDGDLLGLERIGPDLAHAGSRSPTNSVAWVVDHLRFPRTSNDPESRRPWSIMPSYDYLSNAELTALGVYVTGLK